MYNENWYELYHYGVTGQKKGVRRWQNPDGSLTPAGYEHYGYVKRRYTDANHIKTTVNESALLKRNEYVLKQIPKEIKRYEKGKTAKSVQGVSNMYDNWRKTTHDPKILGGMLVQQLLIGGMVANAISIAHRNHRYKSELIRNGKYYMDKVGYEQAKKLIDTSNKLEQLEKGGSAKEMAKADTKRYIAQRINH